MIELRYQDQDAGDSPYLTRILITDRHLRLDQGRDHGDFILLDRKFGVLTNVTRDQKRMMQLPRKSLPASPPTYRIEEKVMVIRPGTVRVQLYSGATRCSETVAAQKLLPEAAKALAEYKNALAYTQWQTYQNTPADMQQACDLVQHVWGATRSLAHGLPLEEQDYAGRSRVLVASGRKSVKPALFRLPRGYAVIAPPGQEEARPGSVEIN